MNLLVSRNLFVVIFLFSSLFSVAQVKHFDRVSLELGTGVHVPLAPNDGISRSKYIAFKQFHLGGRYMFTETFGVKGYYAFNHFSNPDNNNQSLVFNRLGLEGVANLGQLFNVEYRTRRTLNMLLHAGGGISFANPSSVSGTDHMGNIMVGLTGLIRVGDRFAIMGDMTLINNIKQHYAYNGNVLDPNLEAVTGKFVNVSVGIIYYLGSENNPADWY